MKNMETIHENAIQNLRIFSPRFINWREDHPKCPDWIAAKIIAAKKRKNIREAAHDAIHPRWPDTPRENWSWKCEYRGEMEPIVRGVMAVTSLRGPTATKVAKALRNKRYSWGVDYSAADLLADSDIGGQVGWIRANRRSPENNYYVWDENLAELHHPGNGIRCIILMALYAEIETDYIGRAEAERELARLAADPAAKIGGYLADSILSWRSGNNGYEHSSGGESKLYFRTHPELWDYLMSRSPVGKSTATAIQVLPHERAKADACHAAGLFHTLRLSDSIYSGSAEVVAKVVAEIAASPA